MRIGMKESVFEQLLEVGAMHQLIDLFGEKPDSPSPSTSVIFIPAMNSIVSTREVVCSQ